MNPITRCKVMVESIEMSGENEVVRMHAVYADSEENKQWSTYTPSASFIINISNPNAQGKFERNKEYYVDFISCEAN